MNRICQKILPYSIKLVLGCSKECEMHLVARHCRALWIAPNRPKLRGAIFRLSKRNSQFYKSNHLTILKEPTSSFYLNKDLEKSWVMSESSKNSFTKFYKRNFWEKITKNGFLKNNKFHFWRTAYIKFSKIHSSRTAYKKFSKIHSSRTAY